MKIGDMVVRAYAYHAFIPGIIVDEQHAIKEATYSGESYSEINFTIAWSDNSTSHEMDIELDYLEEALGVAQKFEVTYPKGR